MKINNTPFFQTIYFFCLLFILNELRSYGCEILSSTSGLWNEKTLDQHIYIYIYIYIYIFQALKPKLVFLCLNLTFFTSFTSMRHTLLIFKPISVIFVTLDAPRKGLQNLLNVQRLLTNVEKEIKFYLQRFFT